MLGMASVVTLLLLRLSPVVTEVTFDESTVVYDGQRVVQGQVPYRDFFNFIPPGTFYLEAGSSLLRPGYPETTERYAVFAAVLLCWAGTYFLLKHSALDRISAGLASTLLPVCAYSFASSAPHHWFGTCSYVWAAVVAAGLLEKPDLRAGWVLLGALAGLTGWFMQTEALYCGVMVLFAALVNAGTPSTAMKRLLLVGLSTMGVSAVLWAPVLLSGGAGEAWRDVVLWPVTHYRQPGNSNDLPVLADLPERLSALWKPLSAAPSVARGVVAMAGTILYAAILAFAMWALALALWSLGRAIARRKLPSGHVTTAAAVVILTAGTFAAVNPTWVHLVYILVPAAPFMAVAVARGEKSSPAPGTSVRGPLVLLLVCGFVFNGAALVTHRPAGWELVDVDRVDRESPLNRSLRALPYMQPGDSMAVLPVGGNVYLYTYRAAIGYTYFFPLEDRYHDLEDNRRVAAEIDRERPKIILIQRVREKAFLKNDSPVAIAVKENYQLNSQSPGMSLYLRKDVAP